MSPSLVSRFQGCLLGQCLGDALGSPVEAQNPFLCKVYVDEELRQGRAGERDRGSFSFGQYTDDSQLARELFESLVERGDFVPADYARRISAIFSEDRIVGYGQSTLQAAKRLEAGVSWEQAGTPPPASGNGTAMRAAPIGLFFHKDPQRLIEASRDQSRITHQDPRCAAGAVAISGAVALVLEADAIEPGPFLQKLSAWTGAVEPQLSKALLDLEGWLALPPERAVGPISRVGLPDDYFDGWYGISPFVIGSVLWSLYSFLRSPQDYWETICTAIAVGGDVDTTAAMAGAISGAYLGEGVLPPELLKRLNDRGSWGAEELSRLAIACCEKSGQKSGQ